MSSRLEVGDYRYKVIILGKVGVGKTSLFIRIRDDTFVETSAQSTVGGTDVFTYTTSVGEDRVTVSIISNSCILPIDSEYVCKSL